MKTVLSKEKDCLGLGKLLALNLIERKAKVIIVSESDEKSKQLAEQKSTKEAIRPHLPIQLLVDNNVVAILHSFLEVNPNDIGAYLKELK
ncbi:unnamed protein product [Adineta steineri]|uniref:Uncharacterized protein n=1 Tax=Adineta steineri TaxID=433720 RepID=A0A815GCC9_9BILA|nr:unnamed protein product [Adineta steineri]